jgi:gamma-glutamyl-gamma-aminobutyrate hydrolase PuuD
MTESSSEPGGRTTATNPLVGVTFNSVELGQFALWRRMFHGIAAAGATPVAIDCRDPRTNVEDLVFVLDGLVLGGGGTSTQTSTAPTPTTRYSAG